MTHKVRSRFVRGLVSPLIVTILFFLSIQSSAQSSASHSFPLDVSKNLDTLLPLPDGRVVFTGESDRGVTIRCYGNEATLLWSSTYESDYVKHTAGSIWVESQKSIALLLRKDKETWQVSLIDANGHLKVKHTINLASQAPVVLNHGVFYLAQENGQTNIMRLAWDGSRQKVDIKGNPNFSMLWYESCDVKGGYFLVATALQGGQSVSKSIFAFDENEQLRWTMEFKNRDRDLYLSSVEVNSQGETVFWVNSYDGDTATSYIICVDVLGKKKWQKRVLCPLGGLLATVIAMNSTGECAIWGTSDTGSIAFELRLNKRGEYLSHRTKEIHSLYRYLRGEAFAKVVSPNKNMISFIPFDAMPAVNNEVPMALLDVPVFEDSDHN